MLHISHTPVEEQQDGTITCGPYTGAKPTPSAFAEAEECRGQVDGLEKAQQGVAALPGVGHGPAEPVAPHQVNPLNFGASQKGT